MIRIAFAAIVAVSALQAWAEEPPAKKEAKKEPKSVPATRASIRLPVPKSETEAGKGFAKIVEEANAEFQKAEGQDGFKPILEKLTGKIVAHAKKHPKDPATLESLVLAIGFPASTDESKKDRQAAIEMINAEFVKDASIRKHLRQLAGSMDDAGIEIVKAVYKNHPDKTTQAYAAKALISSAERRVQMAEMIQKTPAARENFEKFQGKDVVQKLLDNVDSDKKAADGYRLALRNELKGVLPDLEVGGVAPETVSVNLEGKTVKLSELRGKVVVLDFWATWCGPCRAMIPHTREVVKKMEGKPFVFVSISVDDEKSTLTEFIEKTPMPWSHWWDGESKVSQQWEIEGYPTIFVLDQKGVIRFKTLGYDTKSNKLDDKIEELIKEAEKK